MTTAGQLARHATEPVPPTVPIAVPRPRLTLVERAQCVAAFVGGVLMMLGALLLGAWIGLNLALSALGAAYYVAGLV